QHCHIILRGGSHGPNWDAESVAQVVDNLGDDSRMMIDASHANSGKDHVREVEVTRSIAKQIAEGDEHIAGIMIEFFLVGGEQSLDEKRIEGLTYGHSITDACMDISDTVDLLAELAAAVRTRRATR